MFAQRGGNAAPFPLGARRPNNAPHSARRNVNAAPRRYFLTCRMGINDVPGAAS